MLCLGAGLDMGNNCNVSLYRGDFNFNMRLNETPARYSPVVSVFWFLEQAFNRLMKEQKIKEHDIYPTMLWSKYESIVCHY